MPEVPQQISAFSEKAVICNINPEPMAQVFRTYHAPYQIKSPAPDMEYALTTINWCKGYADMGDMNPVRPQQGRSEFIISARDIAADICKTLNSDVADVPGSFWGLFVCDGDKPTPIELSSNHKKFEKTLEALVKNADIAWTRYHRHEVISDACRMAARYFKLDREWALNAQPSEAADCPACGSRLPNSEVAVCKQCGAVIDAVKAQKYGLAPVAAGR